MEKETRAFPVRLEVRAREGESDAITGYAAVFNALSEDLGGFRERIAPGAFARSIAQNDVRALWDHDPKYVLGRNKAGTLALEEDETGLRVEIDPPDTVWAGDLVRMMQRGDVDQMSFGFYVRDDAWAEEDGVAVRTLRDVDLFDVSIVTFPAYPQTSAEARAMAEQVSERPGSADKESERARARARRAARQREIEILSEVVR